MSARATALWATAALVAAASTVSGADAVDDNIDFVADALGGSADILPPVELPSLDFSSGGSWAHSGGAASSGDGSVTKAVTTAAATTTAASVTTAAATTTKAPVATTSTTTEVWVPPTRIVPTRFTAPPSKYPATVAFKTQQPDTFWSTFKAHVALSQTTRGMAAAAATTAADAGNEIDGYIFVGCVGSDAEGYGCSVGFARAAEASTVTAAANSGQLESLGISAAAVVTPDVTVSFGFARGGGAVMAVAAAAASAVAMLLA